jgi:hypothetical protein
MIESMMKMMMMTMMMMMTTMTMMMMAVDIAGDAHLPPRRVSPHPPICWRHV